MPSPLNRFQISSERLLEDAMCTLRCFRGMGKSHTCELSWKSFQVEEASSTRQQERVCECFQDSGSARNKSEMLSWKRDVLCAQNRGGLSIPEDSDKGTWLREGSCRGRKVLGSCPSKTLRASTIVVGLFRDGNRSDLRRLLHFGTNVSLCDLSGD